MKTRILSLFLALLLVFPLLSGNVHAAGDATEAAAAQLRAGMEQRLPEIDINYGSRTDLDISDEVLEAAYDHTGVPTQGDYLRHYVRWSGRSAGGTTLGYELSYLISLEQEAVLTGYLTEVMDSFGFTDQTDDYTKIKTVYDFVCGNVIYFDDYSTNSTAYEALLTGGASDEGISALLYRMLLAAGIDCRVIADDESHWNHTWNLVKLGGVYYHLDASADASSAIYQAFLLCDASFTAHNRGAAYSSEEFYAAYPMAQTDFDCDRIFGGNYPAVSDNTAGQYNTYLNRYGVPVNSTLYAEDGGYVRVEALKGGIAVERYDESFAFLSRKTFALGLPLYGGVHIGADYNFVISGQNNPECSDEVETYRVERYTKDWEYVDCVGLLGANTVNPFDAGSLRCTESGGILYVRTCHQMYNGHQSSVMIAVRTADMALVGAQTEVANVGQGYVSHSFNQFILADGKTLLAVDHGDYYPRAVVMMKYRMEAGSATYSDYCTSVDLLPISTGSDHYNNTGVRVGGFQASGTHYLVAGSSADQSADGTELSTAQQNIFVTATDKNDFTAEGTTVTWLTDYTETAIDYVHLVKIDDSRLCLLWDTSGTSNYVFLNATGAVQGDVYTSDAPLSDCVPVLVEDRILWYACQNGQLRFYSVDLNDPGHVTEYHNHKYVSNVTAPTCTEQGYTTHTCLICGASYVDSYTALISHSCESVVTAPTCTEQGYTTHTCTVCGYSYADSYVPAAGHSYGSWYTEKAAACTEEGVNRRDCSACDAYETAVIPAAGHSYASRVTAPTCTEQGYTTFTCTVCSDSYADSYVPAAGHSYISRVTAPTCTEQGYTTHTCTVCGDSYKDSFVPAAGHRYGSWYTEKAAACTEEGTSRRDCSACDAYETAVIPATGHSYASRVTAPTCTEQGYTTHTCTVCGDSYKDSFVSAAGHRYGSWYTEKAAACAEEGTSRRDCSACDAYETAVIPAAGHSYASRVTAPTCTEQGYTTFTCQKCAHTYQDDFRDALGHDYVDHICARCGREQFHVEAPAVKGSNVASSGKVRLTWAAVENAAKYQVYRATSKTGTYKLLKTTTGTTFTNTSAVAGSTYYYYIVAVAENGTKSEQSNTVTRTCDLPRPVVSISNVASSGKIKLTWAAIDGAVSYKIYRSTSKDGTYTLMKTTTGTSYTNTSANAGTTYYYKVVAVAEKSAANSAYSSYKSRTCDLPRPVVSIALKSGKPRLTWAAIDGAVSYKIYRSTSKDGTYSLMKTTTGTSYTNTSAKAGVTYYYKVIAVHSKSAANSAYSLVDSIKAK